MYGLNGNIRHADLSGYPGKQQNLCPFARLRTHEIVTISDRYIHLSAGGICRIPDSDTHLHLRPPASGVYGHSEGQAHPQNPRSACRRHRIHPCFLDHHFPLSGKILQPFGTPSGADRPVPDSARRRFRHSVLRRPVRRPLRHAERNQTPLPDRGRRGALLSGRRHPHDLQLDAPELCGPRPDGLLDCRNRERVQPDRRT